MKKLFQNILIGALGFAGFVSCEDHDSPELSPIDTTEIGITASITLNPSHLWYTTRDEYGIKVGNIDMTAPQGTVIRTVSLLIDGQTVMEKPWSGDMLEFQLPLSSQWKGKHKAAIWCKLIRKNARDADYIIKDNMDLTVFDEIPQFNKDVAVRFTVSGKSATGETYSQEILVPSDHHGQVEIPSSDLYPDNVSSLQVTMEIANVSVAAIHSDQLQTTINNSYWNTSDKNTITLKIPNEAGALENALKEKHLFPIIDARIHGTHEGIAVDVPSLVFPLDGVKERP